MSPEYEAAVEIRDAIYALIGAVERLTDVIEELDPRAPPNSAPGLTQAAQEPLTPNPLPHGAGAL